MVPKISTSLSSDLQVYIWNVVSSQIQSSVASQLSETDVPVSTVRLQLERVLFFHPRPSPYGGQLGYDPEDAARELGKESDGTTVARPSKVYTSVVVETARIERECIVKDSTIHFLVNPRN